MTSRPDVHVQVNVYLNLPIVYINQKKAIFFRLRTQTNLLVELSVCAEFCTSLETREKSFSLTSGSFSGFMLDVSIGIILSNSVPTTGPENRIQ